MSEKFFFSNLETIIFLLIVITLSAILLKKIKFSYTIGLVLIGMILALFAQFEQVGIARHLANMKLSSKVILYLLLPSLIFESAIHINTRLFVKNLKPILTLAIPGLFISMIIIGLAASYFTALSLSAGLLFGALISATDPVAVISLFQEIGAPKRLAMLVDGESLLNDATAICAFGMLLSLLLSPFHSSFGLLSLLVFLWNFFSIFFGGIAVGLVVTYTTIKIISHAKRNPLVQITAMTFIAYMTFLLAEHYLHVSGVMAVLTSGIMISWYIATNLKSEIKKDVHQFWECLAFLANSVLFLTLGVTEFHFINSDSHSDDLFTSVFWIILSVLIARCIVVYIILPLLNFSIQTAKIKPTHKHIIFWGGLRGAVPLSLAFSLNRGIENQQLIVELTLAVVLFSLLVQGTTLRFLIRFFKLEKKGAFEAMNKAEVQLEMKRQGLKRIGELEKEHCFDKRVIDDCKAKYNLAIADLQQTLQKSKELPDFCEKSMKKVLWYHTMLIEKEVYYKLFDQSFISKSVLHELILNIDLARDTLKQGRFPDLFVLHVPFETALKNFIGRVGFRFFSSSTYLFKMIQQAYVTKYEISVSMIISCNHVRSMMSEISKIYRFDERIINECIQFYDQRKKLAMDCISKIGEEDIPTPFRQGKLCLIALSAEYNALNALFTDNQILEKNYLDLKSEMESFLDKLKKQVESKALSHLLTPKKY